MMKEALLTTDLPRSFRSEGRGSEEGNRGKRARPVERR